MKFSLRQIQEHITNILREYAIEEEQFPYKQAVAYAYTNLLMEDPELVTDRHIKILQRELSAQQIMRITHYVLDQIGEKAYVDAFRIRCSQILAESVS